MFPGPAGCVPLARGQPLADLCTGHLSLRHYRNHLGGTARVWPGYRRNHGGAPLCW